MAKKRARDATLPTIFLFDLDNTLVGNTAYCLNRWHIIEYLKDRDALPKTVKPVKEFIESLPRTLLRPGLKHAFDKIKSMFRNAEFFIYSAGSDDYVKVMVEWIEDTTGVQFRRPIFSRSNTLVVENGFRKSLHREFPPIMRALMKDYPSLEDTGLQQHVLDYHTIFIDDMNVLADHEDKWLRCPSYDYTPVVNVIEHIPISVLNNTTTRDFMESLPFFSEPEDATEDERNMMFHIYMAQSYQHHLSINRNALEDDFFHRFVRALHKVKDHKRPFSAKNVQKIQNAI